MTERPAILDRMNHSLRTAAFISALAAGAALLSACGHTMEERAATGAAAGMIVGGPVGAAIGGVAGAAVDTFEKETGGKDN